MVAGSHIWLPAAWLCTFLQPSGLGLVPDMASYIRGWIQMVLAPNDLFSWNNKYNKYYGYSVIDTFPCFFLAMHTTHSVHAGIQKPWRGRLPWPLVVFSFYHVFSPPLSGPNWRSLFPPWGSGPPFPKMAPPFTGSAHTPLPGSGTGLIQFSSLSKWNYLASFQFVYPEKKVGYFWYTDREKKIEISLEYSTTDVSERKSYTT